MNEIAIIIPSRLAAERLPNKPLEKINNKQMILHVHDSAIKARLGQVYVASPDQEILEIVKAHEEKPSKLNLIIKQEQIEFLKYLIKF